MSSSRIDIHLSRRVSSLSGYRLVNRFHWGRSKRYGRLECSQLLISNSWITDWRFFRT
jgi:hypothetical protein